MGPRVVARVGFMALLGLSHFAAAGGGERDGWEMVRVPARDFAVKDLSGHVLRTRDLAGKIVVVDFWATWCTPCIKELPDLSAYQERLKGRSDMAFLSFDVTDPRDTLEAFVKEKKIGFPVYLADALLGPYEVTVFPTKLIIDMREDTGKPGKAAGRGVMRFRREGSAPVPSIEARVAELLAEKP
ncbi:MAG TPA: TlpA disulfide reductase family protein [Vicinamibacteria bacterium]|nr:TlpA disulfide reductase family protein [Vicinamibacteria bacterium]